MKTKLKDKVRRNNNNLAVEIQGAVVFVTS